MRHTKFIDVINIFSINILSLGNFLAVQWLGLGGFTAGGLGSIPGRGTKIPQYLAAWPKKPQKT